MVKKTKSHKSSAKTLGKKLEKRENLKNSKESSNLQKKKNAPTENLNTKESETSSKKLEYMIDLREYKCLGNPFLGLTQMKIRENKEKIKKELNFGLRETEQRKNVLEYLFLRLYILLNYGNKKQVEISTDPTEIYYYTFQIFDIFDRFLYYRKERFTSLESSPRHRLYLAVIFHLIQMTYYMCTYTYESFFPLFEIPLEELGNCTQIEMDIVANVFPLSTVNIIDYFSRMTSMIKFSLVDKAPSEVKAFNDFIREGLALSAETVAQENFQDINKIYLSFFVVRFLFRKSGTSFSGANTRIIEDMLRNLSENVFSEEEKNLCNKIYEYLNENVNG